MNTLTDAVKGTHCAYALRLEGDAHAHEYYYVGSTTDLQTRIAQHTGATALHPPTNVMDVVPCANAFQAACVEIAMWGLLAGRCKDFNRVRGGKLCMSGALQYPPNGWGGTLEKEETFKRTLDDAEYPLSKR